MKSDVQSVLEQMAFAERLVVKLTQPGPLVGVLPSDAEEQRWLTVAAQRLTATAAEVRSRVDQALSLPELKALRIERAQRLEREWAAALRELFASLVREVGQTSPLVETLFPHQRFEKLERGGAALRTFRPEYEVRRNSAYVRRLEGDPEHPRLAGLLAEMDHASAALSALEAPSEDPLTAEALRASISQAGRALERSLQQARALCEAAFVDQPERLLDLGWNERGKKRSARPLAAAEASSDSPLQ